MLETPFFRTYMTLRRCQEITQYLHFSDNDIQTSKVDKISGILNSLVERFQAVYRPGLYIAIDESLVSHKGRLAFKQYNPQKRARFGIKFYECSE